MDFASIVLFLSMYYLRPQEWSSVLSSLHPMYFVMFLAIAGLISRRHGLRFGDIFRTPHGCMMFAYFAWILIDSPSVLFAFKDIQNVMLFYVVIVLTLTNIQRIQRFLTWWAVFIMVLVLLALGSEIGFDPFGSNLLTNGIMKGRLALNLSIFNNPNALGHAVVPVLPMLYFLVFWKRVIAKAWILLMLLPLLCLYLTESKGAFLCGFVTLVVTVTFGRPRMVQIITLVITLSFGYGALFLLPRMDTLHKARTDPGIQGRIDAHTFGLQCLHASMMGVGYWQFTNEFFARGPMRLVEHRERGKPQRREHYPIAPHGAYNQNASELGWPGLSLFIGLLYCCLRTLITAKTANTEEERVRRMLLVMVVSYVVSAWMVDLAYRGMFYMLIATVTAFHRCMMRPETARADEPQEHFGSMHLPFPVPALVPASALPSHVTAMMPASHVEQVVAGRIVDNPEGETVAPPLPVMQWTRIRLTDVILIIIITNLFVRLWTYILTSL